MRLAYKVVGKLNLPRFREEETQPGSILFQLGQAHNPGRGHGAPLQQRGQQNYVHGADSSNFRTVTAANLSGRQGRHHTARCTVSSHVAIDIEKKKEEKRKGEKDREKRTGIFRS